jgi:dephospho-CoA kinase
MHDVKIIGISGTNGSGKDSLGQMLAERHGWLFVSVTDILRDELRKRGEPIERENLRNLSTEWHHQYGASIMTDKAVEVFNDQNQAGQYKGLVIASLRRPGEANRIHELGGKMVWVDAEPKIRYDRIHSRGRSAEDNKTFEEFLKDEEYEMKGIGGTHTLNMNEVKKQSDIFIENSSNDVEEFKNQAEKALAYFIK